MVTRLVGLVLAFVAGALISAVSFDLAEEGFDVGDPPVVGLGVAAVCTAATVCGYAIADNVSGKFTAFVDGFAAGALLVMLIDSMIPESVRKGGDIAGLVTVLGFAVAAALSNVS